MQLLVKLLLTSFTGEQIRKGLEKKLLVNQNIGCIQNMMKE